MGVSVGQEEAALKCRFLLLKVQVSLIYRPRL